MTRPITQDHCKLPVARLEEDTQITAIGACDKTDDASDPGQDQRLVIEWTAQLGQKSRPGGGPAVSCPAVGATSVAQVS
jgi:hypothetical protein